MTDLGLDLVVSPLPLRYLLDSGVAWISDLVLLVVDSCLGHQQPHWLYPVNI